MDEFVTHLTTTTADSIHFYWPDAMRKNVICQSKYTSSRKLRNVNKSEPSTGETKSYQPQLIKIEMNSICLTQLYVEL